MRANRSARSLLLALGSIVLGLAWRLAPLHLPPMLYKYGGSTIWAAMVFWLVAGARPRWRAVQAGFCAFAIAAAVELFKLVPGSASGLDAFRATLAGRLLLGKYFSTWDLVVYGVAIAAVSFGESRSKASN